MDYLKRNTTIPIFEAPENAMRAFHLSHKWASRRRTSFKVPSTRPIDKAKTRKVIQRAKGRDHLLLDESLELIKRCGFPIPDHHLARIASSGVRAWKSLKGPVAFKINRPHVSHKSDGGFLRLDIDSEDQILKAFNDFKIKAGGNDLEILIQPMLAAGREIILGGKQDDVFGPVILFGLGGIFVEALRDVVWRVAPISSQDARAMVMSTQGSRILKGIRGEDPYDVKALEAVLVNLSALLVDLPEIMEIDINPLMVRTKGQGVMALDARVILDGHS